MSTLTVEHDFYLVENWDTETLINFLKEQNLKLDDNDFKILCKEKITGLSFLDLTKEKFCSVSFALGPATLLTKEVQTLKEKPKRTFSSYFSLSEVLAKYNFVSEGTEIIPFSYRKPMKSRRTISISCCVWLISTYSFRVMEQDATNKKFSMKSEYEIIGNEICRQVDYAIKESLICVTEDKVQQKLTEGFAQNIKQLESSYKMNKRK
ncbi:hypothetical protein RclHR1_18160006 [Rhizophagus clarus]|uniref:SAM domain-containing protein n=1 Tax=Rhizophagus clarus TaxID=94130 RepID=A0A2Z6R0C2_9GLOM|nr:hypothetical protein RclHR1_18160006 [Rhizophagus clarus]